jgi:ribokinase
LSVITVSGLINIETTLQVENFPIHYTPVRYPFFGINSTVSGVGYNLARALSVLGDSVTLVSLIGRDPAAELVRKALKDSGIEDQFILSSIERTSQSVILYDADGRRQINVDLKDIQEQVYPEDLFLHATGQAAVVALCNVNFSRALLKVAQRTGKIIATDVHAISSLEDDYNQDFMAAADILFMSNELLPEPPEEFARHVADRFGTSVIVIGLGARGALLYQSRDGNLVHILAVNSRPVVSTIGAGDALFSCFLHYFAKGFDPRAALSRAVVFAGYKIGSAGAAEGFLDEAALERQLLLLGGEIR